MKAEEKTPLQQIVIDLDWNIGSAMALYYDLRIFYKNMIPGIDGKQAGALAISKMRILQKEIENARL